MAGTLQCADGILECRMDLSVWAHRGWIKPLAQWGLAAILSTIDDFAVSIAGV